jgi:alpha-D-ribose 1-methylphosphonate 5-triphosphate synthase subunit PhnL
MNPMIAVEDLEKHFVLHLQGGLRLSVLQGVGLQVRAGECVAISGPSGAGKSTLLRLLYGNYRAGCGQVFVRHAEEWVDMAKAEARKIMEVRRRTVGYVSQFLRVIPRVPAMDILTSAVREFQLPPGEVKGRAETLLTRLNIPSRLWRISPTTFSGGEQQRINVARCFMAPYPILLLDEPTAALDGTNRRVVIELIQEVKDRGTAVVGVFHDEEVRNDVATRVFEIAWSGKGS